MPAPAPPARRSADSARRSPPARLPGVRECRAIGRQARAARRGRGPASAPSHSLVCFSCTNQNSNFYCLKPTICSDSDNYCVTVSASAGIGNLVDFGHTLNKGCSPICPSPSINLGVASVGTYCCQSFLCNISTAGGGLRASAAVLGLGLLLSLLSALQRLGP
uniref:UPAR/Ly6 domain-containing protein n=1 Tax=Felis catus TaxID=9685 RepID=A0ABI7VU04_FELCA